MEAFRCFIPPITRDCVPAFLVGRKRVGLQSTHEGTTARPEFLSSRLQFGIEEFVIRTIAAVQESLYILEPVPLEERTETLGPEKLDRAVARHNVKKITQDSLVSLGPQVWLCCGGRQAFFLATRMYRLARAAFTSEMV